MEVLVSLGLLLLGGVLLYYGAEWLVQGAAGLATAFGVSSLVVGLTVVSYGTSAPELAVSVLAALDGRSQIALGNVVGSNIANIGLILGITALVAPPMAEHSMARRELPIMIAATIALPLVLLDGTLGRIDAAIFLLGSFGFTYATLRWSRREPSEGADSLAGTKQQRHSKAMLGGLVAVGLVLLFGGGKVFVVGAVKLATLIGMSERVVGLTVVAVGTSLPELAASLVAALRGHSALAIGNVVGSNIFNLLLVLGAAGLVLPMEGSLSAMRLDLAFVGGMTLFCAFALRKPRSVSRIEGALLLLGYVAFLTLLGTVFRAS